MTREVEQLEQAVAGLFAAFRRKRGREQSSGTSVSGTQLRALDRLADEGSATARQLAEYADVTPATMTGLLDTLEARGMIRRERSLTDRRAIQVVLTDHGREMTAEAQKRWQERWQQAMTDVPPEDLQAAIRVLGKAAGIYDRM
ncbi:MarR family winged helix-turn-helix transcriptional regulator [Streptomyces sp. NPDC055992]|uniref:MarR family winged helix-turn-helix transcriptional regulator n=1 Tax=Streptomyces sp. NPDC055992 TaxID=3345673 RepID=UPI0035DE020D